MRAYASRVLPHDPARVWSVVRVFDRLCDWHDAVVDGVIEDGRAADSVGAVRAFHLADGALVRERLLSLDDRARQFTYGFVTPAFPVDNYVAGIRVAAITADGGSFVEWWADFDEPTGREGNHASLISQAIFADGLAGLAIWLAGTAP